MSGYERNKKVDMERRKEAKYGRSVWLIENEKKLRKKKELWYKFECL